MEKNVYQNELNQVRYTAEGKAALKTALLPQSAFQSSRRRCGWGRRSLAGVLAAVLLIGTATALAAPLWEAYFGSLSANERDLMEELSGELPPPVTCGGTTMKPLAAFGADGVFYLMLEIQTPEGTMLPLLDGEDACYTLMDGKNLENRITLVNSNGLEEAEFLGYMIADDYLEDLAPDDNRIRMVVEIHADGTLVGDKWGRDCYHSGRGVAVPNHREHEPGTGLDSRCSGPDHRDPVWSHCHGQSADFACAGGVHVPLR